ncbi:hypothetical protein GCM10022409_31120 [Hymenobacter glaciei]|uniref:Lipoprotein n=1 Tax=Hymenobacter glaciei TaxID=877209 RepID=A0ABP7UGP4_9BACT
MRPYLFLGLAATLLAGCKKDDPAAGLPAATHTGANTAGCLINGQPFVATGFGSGPGRVAGMGGGFACDSAYYLRLNGKIGSSEGAIHLFLNSFPRFKNRMLAGVYILDKDTPYMPAAISSQCLSYAVFLPNDNSQELFGTTSKAVGSVNITHVDEVNRIVSGTFEFTAVSSLDPTKTLRVTSGRFDRQQ